MSNDPTYQADIRQRSEVIKRELRKAQGVVETIRGSIRGLQRECDHPNQYATSCMGDPGTHCPDCGYST